MKKYLSAWRPSLLGITVYKDVMSIVKMILFSPEKLKLRNISSAWLLSLIYEGSDLTSFAEKSIKQTFHLNEPIMCVFFVPRENQ